MQSVFLLIERLRDECLDFSVRTRGYDAGLVVTVRLANSIWEIGFGESSDVEVREFRSDGNVRDSLECLAPIFGAMRRAWEEAASDLGVEFVAPFVLQATSPRLSACGLLPGFGSSRGTVILEPRDDEAVAVLAEAAGYHVPGLNPDRYRQYDREHFRGALREWGWHGPEAMRPTWL